MWPCDGKRTQDIDALMDEVRFRATGFTGFEGSFIIRWRTEQSDFITFLILFLLVSMTECRVSLL